MTNCLLCSNTARCRGYCDKHYTRLKRHGDPEVVLYASPAPKNCSADEYLKHYGWVVTDKGCWEWCGRRATNGYGKARRDNSAHRLAYEAWVGPIPEGHVVRHKCDNPPCINPAHLETGTHRDNMSDMVSRGRGRGTPGVNHRAAKLTEQDVLDIRVEYGYGVLTQQMLADVYGVTQGAVSLAVRGVNWQEAGH